MKKLRKDYIDMARGIAILLMVIGHTNTCTSLNTFIYSFHVPIFFVLSGMLWKERDMKTNLMRWTKSLLVPYILVAAILCPFYWFYNWHFATGARNPGLVDILLGISVPTNTWNGILAFGPVWFLVCMFVGKVFFEMILKVVTDKNVLLLTVAMIGMAAAGTIISGFAMLPWSMDAAFLSLIFSYVGWLLRDDRFPCLMEDAKKCRLLLLVCGVLWIAEMICGSIDMAWRIYPK